MVGLAGVVRMPVLGFLPADDFPYVLDKDLAFGKILRGEDALAMDTRAAGLDTAAAGRGQSCAGHVFSDNLNRHTCACAYTYVHA